MPILGFCFLAKPCIDFCQIESISECKYKGYMVDLLDFRLSPKMHIKIKVSWDSYQNIMECVRALRNCTVQFSCL